jgi:transporter family-2 protein
VPKIGIANAVVAALCGQVILSLILDHFGVLGLSVNSINIQKIIGSVFLILGLLLINGKLTSTH